VTVVLRDAALMRGSSGRGTGCFRFCALDLILRSALFGARLEGWNHLTSPRLFSRNRRIIMARKYSKKASADVERAMKKRKAGTLRSGRSGRKVTSRKQAIAIGLSEARAEGKKVPKKAAKKRTATKRKAKK
jgi:hypothetical protein